MKWGAVLFIIAWFFGMLFMVICCPPFSHGADIRWGYGTGVAPVNQETEKHFDGISVLDLDMLLVENVLDLHIGHIDWRADGGFIFKDTDDVHPKIFSTLIGVFPIYKDLTFNLGGGFGYIHRGGKIHGLGDRMVHGTIRLFFDYHWLSIGIDHYSAPWCNDQGRNVYKVQIVGRF